MVKHQPMESILSQRIYWRQRHREVSHNLEEWLLKSDYYLHNNTVTRKIITNFIYILITYTYTYLYMYTSKNIKKCAYYSESHPQKCTRPALSNTFPSLGLIIIQNLQLSYLFLWLYLMYTIICIMVWVIINTLTYISLEY